MSAWLSSVSDTALPQGPAMYLAKCHPLWEGEKMGDPGPEIQESDTHWGRGVFHGKGVVSPRRDTLECCMSGVEKVSPWNVERGEGKVGSEEGARSRPQAASRTRPPMRGSGRGRVSGRRRQTGRCGEGTRGRPPSACSLPPQIAPPPGECGLKGPSSWSCPSWGPPLSGCSSITRCPTGVKPEKAALVPTPELLLVWTTIYSITG